MEQTEGQVPLASPSSSSTPITRPITSPTSMSQIEGGVQEELREETGVENSSGPDHNNQQQQQAQPSGLSYHVNLLISDVAAVAEFRDDVWSCLIVLVSFWFFVSMTLILGFYGSENLQLGPNCSRLVQANSFFVQYIQVEAIDHEARPDTILYGFDEPPPLDVEITWTQMHNASIQIDSHKKWMYYLNKGSSVDISYNVTPNSTPLSLIIAQGSESLVQWIEDPSYPNSTLSWNIICGYGKIQQYIPTSSNYYIAVRNLNSKDVEVKLNFTVKAFVYSTSQAYSRCSIGNRLCSFKLLLLGTSAAVLTTSSHSKGTENDYWYVKLSYGPRWIAYIVASGIITVLVLLVFRILSMFQTSSPDVYPDMASERTPLLAQKDDEISSWGSSYDSISHDDHDSEEWFSAKSLDGKQIPEGESSCRLCVICFDKPRDCFFLPCGHCAACFSCGTRIAEEAGVCPICRRRMKKVRKVFTV